MELRFYKEEDGRWYVDLPEWEGEKADLEMVLGADTMLDILSNDGTEIKLLLDTVEFPDSKWMVRMHWIPEILASGSDYWLEDHLLQIWLCDVTKFVFGDFPDTIYYKVIE